MEGQKTILSVVNQQFSTLLCISPYSVQMQENTDQNNSEYGHLYAVNPGALINNDLKLQLIQRRNHLI